MYSQSGSSAIGLDVNNLTGTVDPAANPLANSGNLGLIILGAIVIGLLMMALFPIAVASVVFMVEAANKGKSVQLGEVIGRSFKRFWALLGSSIVFSLIFIGIYIVIVIFLSIVMVAATIAGTLAISAESFQNPTGIAGLIIALIILGISIYILIGFFAIRWGFFLPFVAFNEAGLGLGRSWKATKGSFWRLLAVFFTMTVISYAVILVVSLLVDLMQGSVLKAILLVLMNLIISPLVLVVYAVSFFDLKVRTEGSDLESMLQNTHFTLGTNSPEESNEGNV
jgi:hypothetical protein